MKYFDRSRYRRDYFYPTMLKPVKPLLASVASIIIVFIAVSLLDILISVLYLRFYTTAAFIVTFGVGGIFAAVLGYMYGMQQAPNNTTVRWTLIVFHFACGLLFYFLLSKLEGGEYAPAFRAFGATLALGSFLFITDKNE